VNTHDYIVQGLAAEMPRTMTLAEARVTAERMWARVVSRLFPDPPDSSGEWHRFGTHVACRGVPLEFAGEEDSEDGLPLWERVIEPETHARDFPLTDVEEIPCTICGTPSAPGVPCPVCRTADEATERLATGLALPPGVLYGDLPRQPARGFGGLAATTNEPPIV
jgi:hypothetical protein